LSERDREKPGEFRQHGEKRTNSTRRVQQMFGRQLRANKVNVKAPTMVEWVSSRQWVVLAGGFSGRLGGLSGWRLFGPVKRGQRQKRVKLCLALFFGILAYIAQRIICVYRCADVQNVCLDRRFFIRVHRYKLSSNYGSKKKL